MKKSILVFAILAMANSFPAWGAEPQDAGKKVAESDQKDPRTFQLLFDNLCDIDQRARMENAPPTRSTRAVLPFKPPPNLEESPIEYVRHLEKISAKEKSEPKFAKRQEEFKKLFWENFEKNGNKKSEAQTTLKKYNEFHVEGINGKCTLTSAEKMHLLSEVK